MGSGNYHGPNSDCYNCNGCGTHRACDDCSATCCQNNMRSHRQLRSYEESFGNQVNSLCKTTLNKCLNIIDNLKKNHNIDIDIESKNNNAYRFFYLLNPLGRSMDIINKMEEKKNNIIKDASSIDVDYFIKKKIKRLESSHKIIMKKIKEDFDKKVKNKEDLEIKELNKEINKKKKEKNELKKEKKKIESNQQIEIDNFKKKNIERLNNEYYEKVKEINYKYSDLENIKYPVMEYSPEEKEEKKMLLQNIRQIQNYKKIINKIPNCNYESFIQFLKISNYLI